MTPSAQHDAFAALGRMLEARTGIGAVAVFSGQGDAMVRRFATQQFSALGDGEVRSLGTLPGPGAEPLRLSGSVVGLLDASCLVQAIGSGRDVQGFVVLAWRGARPVGPRLLAALRDATDILGPLLGHREPPRGEPIRTGWAPATAPAAAAAPVETSLGAVLPRVAAQRLIASLLTERSRRQSLAFTLLDIDRFRAINEVLGSEVGDRVLAITAERIENCLDPEDRIIRLEGDRFLVVSSPSRRDARALAEALLDAVARPIEIGGRRLALRASIGIVLAGRAETSPVRLLVEADAALRRAKADGGGRAEIHEPGLHAALMERSGLELDLRHALENGELSLVYQPYVELATGEMSGVEALLRWDHPSRGSIPPSTFIPLAETTGLILPMGLWALRSACRAAARWPGRCTLSVNISALQFNAPGFVGEVRSAIAETKFPAERLELEITETVLMRDNPETIAQLKALVALGIRIALDDFGTGYSALAYLSRLPHHKIKLDKSFVQDIGRPSTAGLIRAITTLARASGIAVTAEGVELPEQLETVKKIGFTHAQGFATGLPTADPTPLCRATSLA